MKGIEQDIWELGGGRCCYASVAGNSIAARRQVEDQNSESRLSHEFTMWL